MGCDKLQERKEKPRKWVVLVNVGGVRASWKKFFEPCVADSAYVMISQWVDKDKENGRKAVAVFVLALLKMLAEGNLIVEGKEQNSSEVLSPCGLCSGFLQF